MTDKTETSHWASDYIGKPWEACARGPYSFDCYGLVWFDFDARGIRLPLFAGVDPKDKRLVSACFASCEETGKWIELETPSERCVVAMSEDGKHWTHLGLYTGVNRGMIVHARDGAAVHATPIKRLERLGIRSVRYFEWGT